VTSHPYTKFKQRRLFPSILRSRHFPSKHSFNENAPQAQLRAILGDFALFGAVLSFAHKCGEFHPSILFKSHYFLLNSVLNLVSKAWYRIPFAK